MLALQLDHHIKEEAYMKYFNAQVILPDALLKELQTYVQGEYIYVPVEQEQQKRWGSFRLSAGTGATQSTDQSGIPKRYFHGALI